MFVYVGGIPCVGKTTIIRMTIGLAQKSNLSLQGLEEKELLCQITGVKSAEDYAKLPKEIRAKTRKNMVDYIYDLDEKDLTTIRIRDDHFTAPKEDGTYWVRQLGEKDKTHMLAFVVIVAKPKIILQRRLSRKFVPPEPESEFFDVNVIIQHQEMEVKIASSQADYFQIPLKIIENEKGRVGQATTLLLSFVQEIVKTKKG